MQQIRLFPKQIEFFNFETREALLEAGIGYGKSRVASIWLANQTQVYPKTKWIMAARDYNQLKTAVDAEFEFYMNDILGLERGRDYYKTSGSPIQYKFIRSGSEIYGFGALNYNTSFRAGSYSGVWGDEVDFWAPEAVTALRGRIRIYPERLRFTSSPQGFNHIWQDFYQNKMGPVVNATSYENPTLSPEYFESLKRSYDERYFEQEVMAKRLSITAGRVYYAFDRAKNVRPIPYDKRYPLWAGVDFNIDPMSGVLGQLIPVPGGHKLHIIDEVFLRNSNTEALSLAIKAKYGPDISVVPDSTGVKRTTNANISDIQILKKHFTKVVPGLNPYRVDRYASVNGALANDLVVIDPRCENLIKDLETVSYKQGEDVPDTNDHLVTHISDALGYLIFKTINPLRVKGPGVVSQLR